MNRHLRTFTAVASLILVMGLTACEAESPRTVAFPESSAADDISSHRAQSEFQPADPVGLEGANTEQPQFVVYLGSFLNRASAANYATGIRAANVVVQVSLTRQGRYIVTTQPMDPSLADEIAEMLGGRSLPLEEFEQLTPNYDFLAPASSP
jgi:hypothetical protein